MLNKYTKLLVEWETESMSLNPDIMIKTRLAVAETEKKLKKWATKKQPKKLQRNKKIWTL